MTEGAHVLSIRDVIVRYGKTNALDGFNLDLTGGEIHAIVGERRSGKSSVAKLLGGTVQKNEGTIALNGRIIENFTPATSVKNKIGVIYQDTNLIPSLNAVENIFAGRFRLGLFGIIKQKEMSEKVEQFLAEWGLKFNLKIPAEMLSKEEQYRLELTRAVFFDPDILVFDEISSKLDAEELETAYRLILNMKNRGKSILYISNNMNEIFEFADSVSVLKNGRIISTQKISTVDKVNLIDLTYSFASTREELRKRNEELYNYKKYNEDIIKNMPIGVIILDREQKVYLKNYTASEILSGGEKQSDPELTEILKILPPHLSVEIKSGIDSRECCSWEEAESGDGKFLDIRVFPFHDKDYVFLGTILLIQDVSKDYHFKNYLLRAERISSIAELAAGVAHEVNNPLGIISNYVELLKLKNKDDYNTEKIALIKSELDRIKSIIGGLLSFSRLNETPRIPLDLCELVNGTLLLLNHKFREKNAEIGWVSPKESVVVPGSENLLKQVLINLIVNALDAIEEKGRIDIAIERFYEKGFADLSVSDDGRGISEEDMNKIFSPFYTTKTSGENTGLGLSICQHIIEAHQGMISCRSSEKGSVFTIRLPSA